MKGVSNMSRGNEFNHKRKGHPGNFPEGTLVEGKTKELVPDDEELIVSKEAFKNRVKTDEME